MINLIDAKDISCRKNGQDNVIGLALDIWFSQLLKQKLELGAKTSDLVYTNDLRGIGKTYELIEYARKNDYLVIVHCNAEVLRKEYNYQDIYDEKTVYRGLKFIGRLRNVVVDELVDFDKIKTETDLNIITGYVNGKTYYSTKKKSFNFEVIETLKSELRELMRKMESTLTNGDYGTYKNLAMAFKEVNRLIIDLQENPIR